MNYQLRPPGKNCKATGEPFAPGDVFWSALVVREGKTERWDYSAAAWDGPPEGALGYWRGLVPGAADANRPCDPDDLMRTFEQLCEEASPSKERLQYALALYLLRIRRLALESLRNEFLIVVGTKSEGPYEVRNLQLPDEEIRTLQASFSNTPPGITSHLSKAA